MIKNVRLAILTCLSICCYFATGAFAYTVQGTINAGGVGASNIQVCATTPTSSVCATSDINGAYSLTGLTAGTYKVNLSGGYYNISAKSNVPTPEAFSITGFLTALEVSGDLTKDLTLPFVTLSGKTTDGNGMNVPGVEITVPKTDWTVNATTYSVQDTSYYGVTKVVSDASGNYSLVLLPYNNYTVTLTPPADQLKVFQTTLTGVDGSVTATTELKLKPAYEVSGVVRSSTGQLLSNIKVNVHQSSPSFDKYAISDVNGAYSIKGLAAGTYRVDYSKNGTSTVPTPEGFSAQNYVKALVVSSDVSQDVTVLPFVTLSGKTTDKDGNAVAGVGVKVDVTSWTANDVNYSVWNSTAILSDASGNYSMVLLSYNNYSVGLVPPTGQAGLPYIATTVTAVDVSTTTTKDLKLNPANMISGVVRTPAGVGASFVQVCAYKYVNKCVYTDATGAYKITGLLNTTYQLNIAGGYYKVGQASNVPTPESFTITGYVAALPVSGAVTQDVVLPFVTLSGKTTDKTSKAIAGVEIKVPDTSWTANGVYYSVQNDSYYSTTKIVSDASGNYSMVLLPYNNYSIELTAPTGQGLLDTVVSAVDVSATTTKNLQLKSSYAISGKVRTSTGVAISNIKVCAYQQNPYVNTCATLSDGTGAYSISGLDNGSYDLNIYGGPGNTATSNVPTPQAFSILKYVAAKQVSNSNVTQDVTLPQFVTLSGKTVDSNGAAVPSTAVAVPYIPWTSNGTTYYLGKDDVTPAQAVSGADGSYSIIMLPYSSYRLTVTPPSGNGYVASIQLTDISVLADKVYNIIIPKVGAEYKLTVALAGAGSGSVTSVPTGVNCPTGNCSWNFTEGAQVVLTAKVDDGSVFDGWSGGGCSGTGTCTVAMTSAQTVTATFIKGDTIAPQLAISTLPTGAITDNAVLNITGSATDNKTDVAVTINGTEVSVDAASGTFSQLLLLNPGANVIVTKAVDQSKNQTVDTRTITLQKEGLPAFTITAPSDNSTTINSFVEVSGTFDGTSSVKIAVNGGASVDADLTGTDYKKTVNLQSGLNTIVVTVDNAGVKNSLKRSVYYAGIMSLQVTDPAQDILTDTNSVVLKGRVTDNTSSATVVISVDGKDYTPAVSDGTDGKLIGEFEQPLTFDTEKIYTISVVATDLEGSRAVVRNVYYRAGLVTINNNAPQTNNENVTLTLSYPGAEKMRFSNSSSFSSAWVPYATTSGYTLPLGDGLKTVYVQFGDASSNPLGITYSSSILLDKTAATGSIIINNNAASTKVQNVTLTISAADAGTGVVSMQVSESSTFTGAAWEAYATTKAFTLSAGDGIKTVYARFMDAVGNISAPAVSDTIILDTVLAPTAVISGTPNSPIKAGTYPLTVSGKDVITYKWRLQGGAWSKETALSKVISVKAKATNTYTVDVIGKNAAGMWQENPTTVSWYVDTTLPVTSIDPQGPALSPYNLSKFYFTSEEGATFKCKVDKGAYEPCTSPYTIPALANGKHTLTVQAMDIAGNLEKKPLTYKWVVDYTAPVLTINPVPDTNAATRLISGTKEKGAILASSPDICGASAVPASATKWSCTASGYKNDGITTITFTATDLAGNITTKTADVSYDTTPPTGTIEIAGIEANTYANNASVTLALTCNGTGSACSSMQFKVGDAAWSAFESFSAAKTLTLAATNGAQSVSVQYKDALGNISAPISGSIILDTVAPSGTVVINNGDAVTNVADITLTLSAQDPAPGSNVSQFSYSFDNSTWSAWENYVVTKSVTLPNTVNGSKTVYVKFRDHALNVSAVASDSITLQNLQTMTDLAGDWTYTGLVAGDRPAQIPGWYYGDVIIDTDGATTTTPMTDSEVGTVETPSIGNFSIANGIVTMASVAGVNYQGALTQSNDVMVTTATMAPGSDTGVKGLNLQVNLKRSGATYASTDLVGDWNGHALLVGGGTDGNGWMRFDSTISSNGQVAFSNTASSITGMTYPTDQVFTVSSDGTVTGNGIHGTMSADKKLMVLTLTTGPGANDAKGMIVLVKTGGTFTQTNLEGNWSLHALGATPGSNMWLRADATIDAAGNTTFSNSKLFDGSTPQMDPSQMQLSTAGIMTEVGSSRLLHGIMTDNKEMIVLTQDSDGPVGTIPSLWICVRK